jgi:GTPase KRas protein
MRHCYGFLIVFDLTNKSSLDNLEEFVKEIRNVKDIAEDDPFPCVLVGNKVDLCPNQRQVAFKDAQAWSKKFLNDAPVFETSALTNVNVEESFFQLVRECRRYKGNLPKKPEKPRRKSKLGFGSVSSQDDADSDLHKFKF